MRWQSASPSLTDEEVQAHTALAMVAGTTLNSNSTFNRLSAADLTAAIDAVYLKHQTAFEVSQFSLDEAHEIITEILASGEDNYAVLRALMDRLLKSRGWDTP